ncbi:MAG: RDD family protein [Bacilli bacterium]|nr:RDD family protein [Bacilli bacterium]
MNKAIFSKRLAAFILDVLLVSFCASLLAIPFTNTETINKLNKEAEAATEKYNKKEIGLKTYYVQTADLNYEITRAQGATSLISLLITILYFVVFQFYNKGQTIGKKLMKIKVVNNNGDKLSINNVVLRALIINAIIFEMLSLLFAFIGNKDVFLYASIIIESVQYVIVIATIIMASARKDGRGIHDFLGNTKVVQV